jgi:hypothetical protein
MSFLFCIFEARVGYGICMRIRAAFPGRARRAWAGVFVACQKLAPVFTALYSDLLYTVLDPPTVSVRMHSRSGRGAPSKTEAHAPLVQSRRFDSLRTSGRDAPPPTSREQQPASGEGARTPFKFGRSAGASRFHPSITGKVNCTMNTLFHIICCNLSETHLCCRRRHRHLL